jgi:hypothetical protein
VDLDLGGDGLAFENSDNVTHLLVGGFIGYDGQDLDADDNGTLDATPWALELDRIALVENDETPPSGTEHHYGPPQIGPDVTTSGSYVPNHAYRDPDGGTWTIGTFDPLGETDTPGASNEIGEGCTALDARSVKDHAGSDFKVAMGVSGGIEARTGQITQLEIDLDSSASVSVTDTASVSCSTNGWSGTATVTDVSTNGVTVTVEFSPALTNGDKCVITLDCMTRLSEVCVRDIEGDMNADGNTNTTDASAVKLRFGQTVTDANARWDFNRDGAINTTDASAVKLRFGNTAPTCP